jgi:hypothetical protein
MKWLWGAVGFVAVFFIAYFIASATGRPVHLDRVSTVSSSGPTGSRWYLIVGKGPDQVRLGIPGTSKHLSDPGDPTPVLVAKRLIPKGMPGLIVATNSMYWAATTIPGKDIEVGAIADPSYLNGRAAAVDILPGEQIITSDFASPVPSMTVLVATEPIPKGTSGSTVVANGMYRATVPRPQQRQVGAISDPSYLRDRASVADIQLGQQLTEANFPATG